MEKVLEFKLGLSQRQYYHKRHGYRERIVSWKLQNLLIGYCWIHIIKILFHQKYKVFLTKGKKKIIMCKNLTQKNLKLSSIISLNSLVSLSREVKHFRK